MIFSFLVWGVGCFGKDIKKPAIILAGFAQLNLK
jgi:hypothetical protein